MLTADEIRDLSDLQAQEALEASCIDLYGDRWKTAYAREIDMSPRQVNHWQEQGNRPPAWAIMLAQSLADSRKMSSCLKSLDAALTGVRDLSKRL